MNIFIREMKAYRKSLIIWCIAAIFMVVAGMAKFEALSTSGESLKDMFSKMPKTLQALMGGTGSLDMSTVIGYYGMLFIFLLVMAAIHASMLGAGIIAKEERDKTAEFLMVKPISRNKIITSKLAAALVNIIFYNIVTLVSSIAIIEKYNKGANVNGDILTLMLAMFILQLLFLFLGTCLASVTKNTKAAVSVTAAIVVFTYIISVAVDLNDNLGALRYITPFKYFEAKNVILNKVFDPVYVILSVVIIAALLSVTYVFYKKRDLNI